MKSTKNQNKQKHVGEDLLSGGCKSALAMGIKMYRIDGGVLVVPGDKHGSSFHSDNTVLRRALLRGNTIGLTMQKYKLVGSEPVDCS
jgi:hypothetical protein